VGLSAGDLLISCDNLQVTAQFEQQLQDYALGERLSLHWFRRDVLMAGSFAITQAIADTISLQLVDPQAAKRWL
jgi:predicted metalloprotease with PDZ domain